MFFYHFSCSLKKIMGENKNSFKTTRSFLLQILTLNRDFFCCSEAPFSQKNKVISSTLSYNARGQKTEIQMPKQNTF